MRMRILLELRMRTTWLRMRIINLKELFLKIWGEIGQKNWIYTCSSRSPKRKKN